MELDQLLNGLGSNERHIAGQNQDVFIAGDSCPRTLNCVPSAALFRLLDKLDTLPSHRLADQFGMMANDDKDIGRRNDLTGSCNDVTQQRLAANFVQHFWPARFQPRTLARSHDHNCEFRPFDRRPLYLLAHCCFSAGALPCCGPPWGPGCGMVMSTG